LVRLLRVDCFISEYRVLMNFMGTAVACFMRIGMGRRSRPLETEGCTWWLRRAIRNSSAGQRRGVREGKFMKIFDSLWRRHGRSETKIILLNSALDLALDFDNWLSPIQGRLKASHPSLDEEQLEMLNQVCMEAVRFGQETALHLCATMNLPSVQGRFEELFVNRCPWVNQENLERAYRHCIYLATKTARAG
jgi:hypothetical protein